MSNTPLISVVMITYNHEKYIEEAINGVLMQKIDAPVELIISNDCSTDKTDEVIKRCIERNANSNITIHYISHYTNIGMMPNFIFALEQAKGEYIALCEGDDTWIDENKLQLQLDYFKKNKECVLHCFNVNFVSNTSVEFKNRDSKEYKLNDIIAENPFYTCAVMFLKSELKFNFYSNNSVFGDWLTYTDVLQSNKNAFFDNKICVNYRVHHGGVFSNYNAIKKNNGHLEILQKLANNKFVNHNKRKDLISQIYKKNFQVLFNAKSFFKSLSWLLKDVLLSINNLKFYFGFVFKRLKNKKDVFVSK